MTCFFFSPCQDERPTLVIWIVATHFVMIRGRQTTFDFLLLSAPTFISFLVENEMNTWKMKLWPPPGKPWCFFSMWQNYLNNKDSNVIYELFAFLCFYTALRFRFAFFFEKRLKRTTRFCSVTMYNCNWLNRDCCSKQQQKKQNWTYNYKILS